MVSNQELDLDDVNSESAKVPDLIFVLRSAFQPKDFKKVEEILVSRENRLNEEINYWKREYGLVEEKEGATAIGKALVEQEMGKCKRQLDVLTEQVTRLNEDKRVLEDREKRVQAKCTKLVEDIERLERENKELVAKKSEFYSERVKVERELESEQKKNEDFKLRVARLEEDMYDLSKLSSPVEEEKGSTDAMNDISGNSIGVEVKNVIFDGKEIGISSAGNNSGDDNVKRPKRNGEDFGIHRCAEGQMVLERDDSSHTNKRQKTNTTVINISDSDNEVPTQNQTLNMPNISDSNNEEPTQDQTSDMPNIAGSEQPGGGNRSTLTGEERRELFLDIGGRIENDCNNNGLRFPSSSSASSDCDSDTLNCMVSKMKTKGVDSSSTSSKPVLQQCLYETTEKNYLSKNLSFNDEDFNIGGTDKDL